MRLTKALSRFPHLAADVGSEESADWVIKGVEELDADACHHMCAFYMNLKDLYCEHENSSVLLTRVGCDERVAFGMFLIQGDDCRSAFQAGTTSAYKFAEKYHVVTVGEESKVLVLRPQKIGPKKRKGVVDVTAMRLEDLQQPTYLERLFIDLWKIHQDDHCKGNTLYITCEVCKIFTDVYPHCVKVLSRRKPPLLGRRRWSFNFMEHVLQVSQRGIYQCLYGRSRRHDE